MKIVVQKYGGSSLAEIDQLRRVAKRIMATASAGHRVVIVVSAMGKTTSELLDLAKQVSPEPHRRELDMLLTAGERISMALLSMAISDLGGDAISFTGSQAGIITTDRHVDARIIEVRPQRVEEELDRGRVVIVAGYQGVSRRREITTLGRGGSDTTAVALAAALGAEWCEICSDVDGVYSADPRVVPDACRIDKLSFEESQELAEAGARVLNAQAVEFAKQKGITIFARATTSEPLVGELGGTGTTVSAAQQGREPGTVIGVASEVGLTLLQAEGDADSMLALLDREGVAAKQLHVRGGGRSVSMVISEDNLHDGDRLRRAIADRPDAEEVSLREGIGAVSVIGAGINQTNGNLRRGQAAIIAAGSKVIECFTSSFRITWLLPESGVEKSVRALHAEFFNNVP